MTDDSDLDISEYLDYLSKRIRGLRAGRGMSRKLLSEHSSISERYLAQLESGKANPSVTLLWRIAAALGVDFHHLFAGSTGTAETHSELQSLLCQLSKSEQRAAYEVLVEKFDKRRQGRHGVALIGLRGAGKTTLGRALAGELGLPFVRLTEQIEMLCGMDIGELVSLGGQRAFRRFESQALEDVIDSGDRVILEVGGSLVSEPATFSVLCGAFHTIWLRARPEDHMDRVSRQGDTRPMEGSSQAMTDLRGILEEREVEYGKADFSLDTSGRTIEYCLNELAQIAAETLMIDPKKVTA